MAWHTQASSNDDMVDKLEAYGLLHEHSPVSRAFRVVDRGAFTHPSMNEIYHDQPLRYSSWHQSAPHIYAKGLEALELESGKSFLNIGSGTGYLSTMAAYLCGESAFHHGIDIDAGLVEFATTRHNAFREGLKLEVKPDNKAPLHGGDLTTKKGKDVKMAKVTFFHGNVFDLSIADSARYDRIYVGAGCPENKHKDLCQLLSPGGIMIGPFDDQMVKTRRATGLQGDDSSQKEFVTTVIVSSVRFASLMQAPSIPCTLPKAIWSQETHSTYSKNFQDGTITLLLCAQRLSHGNITSALSNSLILEILEYLDRDWFAKSSSAVQKRKHASIVSSGAAKSEEGEAEDSDSDMCSLKALKEENSGSDRSRSAMHIMRLFLSRLAGSASAAAGASGATSELEEEVEFDYSVKTSAAGADTTDTDMDVEDTKQSAMDV